MHPFTKSDLDQLRLDLTLRAKNGLNFILAATLLWLLITYIWTLPISMSGRNVYTLWATGLMFPLAIGFSKLIKSSWSMPDNPLQPLGIWLNVAQLGYFPILAFMYVKHPQYFIMTYAVITGAHFLPYAWFYNTPAFLVMGLIVAIGATYLGFVLPTYQTYYIPFFTGVCMMVLATWLYVDYRRKLAVSTSLSPVN